MTTFWNYQYFLANQTNTAAYIKFGLLGLILVLFIFSLWRYWRNRQNSRNREIVILLLLASLILFIGQYNSLEQTRTSLNNSQQVKTFFQSVAQSEKVNLTSLAINQTYLSSGMIVKIGTKFYQVTFNNDAALTSYTLTSTNLINNRTQIINK